MVVREIGSHPGSKLRSECREPQRSRMSFLAFLDVAIWDWNAALSCSKSLRSRKSIMIISIFPSIASWPSTYSRYHMLLLCSAPPKLYNRYYMDASCESDPLHRYPSELLGDPKTNLKWRRSQLVVSDVRTRASALLGCISIRNTIN